MIITSLNGGLGNQMFQYAIGRALAAKNNDKLRLDLSGFSPKRAIDTPRQYELSIFNLQATKFNSHILDFFHPPQLISETSHTFDPAILNIKGNIRLVGYWQSEKYFNQYSELIRHDFAFPTPPTGKNKALLLGIDNSNSVSIHVRRGDYVSNQTTNQFHGVCSLAYYRKAIKSIKDKVKNPIFYVFSDDPEWCKDNLTIAEKTTYISHNSGEKSWEDMRLMSHCKYNIIANSSFSWWGAWLNDNPTKIVIAPQKWFNDPSIDTQDVIPDSWLKM